MQVNKFNWETLSLDQKNKFFNRSETDISDIKEKVQKIIDNVKNNGDKALYEFSQKFDGVDLKKIGLKVTENEFNEVDSLLSEDLKKALDFCMENVKIFHEKQVCEDIKLFEVKPGIYAGEKAIPIESLAIYVPRGRGSFPSMLYMNAIPAMIAKVKRICIVTPPDKEGKVDPACLYVAKKCGITEIYKIGGAQAIAALSYGTESIKKVTKITGPGSIFVTAAKRLLYGVVDVGLPAGPSESVLIADKTTNPYIAALDLMTEAEHGSDSCAILLTDSNDFANSCIDNIKMLIEKLPEDRKKFVCDVFSNYGGVIITKDIEESIEIANKIATEHLKISCADASVVAEKIINAGEIIIGENTPFSAANYAIGPNAILPTGGNARTFSAISVRDFVKYSSIITTSKNGYDLLYPHVLELAKYEGFASHYNALKLRENK